MNNKLFVTDQSGSCIQLFYWVIEYLLIYAVSAVFTVVLDILIICKSIVFKINVIF